MKMSGSFSVSRDVDVLKAVNFDLALIKLHNTIVNAVCANK